jgi:hypothetical protein
MITRLVAKRLPDLNDVVCIEVEEVTLFRAVDIAAILSPDQPISTLIELGEKIGRDSVLCGVEKFGTEGGIPPGMYITDLAISWFLDSEGANHVSLAGIVRARQFLNNRPDKSWDCAPCPNFRILPSGEVWLVGRKPTHKKPHRARRPRRTTSTNEKLLSLLRANSLSALARG